MEAVFDVRVVDPTSNPDWEFCNDQYLDSIRDLKQAPEVPSPLLSSTHPPSPGCAHAHVHAHALQNWYASFLTG